MKSRFAIMIWLLVISACSAPQVTPTQNPQEEATASVVAYPQDEPTIIPTATMTDQEVFDACAETIRAYAASDRCTNWDEYRQLFSPKSGEYNTTPNPENSIYCYEVESAEVVRILTAEEWWNKENPGREMPKAAQPEYPGERVFYVEIMPKFKPDITPIPPRESGSLNRFLMWMLPENGKCLIRDYGW
ncbi:MAG: hypothetical protein HY869_00125 [Chloroflexi bacterium]|nr:hypothetical protein [Chloroflexota bacterium]